MRGKISNWRMLTASSLFLFATCATASAEIAAGDVVPTTIVRVANSPAEITRCQLTRAGGSGVYGTVVVQNRTRRQMGDIRVTLTAYDVEVTKMDIEHVSSSPAELVPPGDTDPYKVNVGFNLSGQERFLARISCRIESAQFSGYPQAWTTAKRWPETLLPMSAPSKPNDGMQNDRSGDTSQESLTAGAQSSYRAVKSAAPPKVTIAVANAWNDVVSGLTLIHDTVVITGGDVDTQVRGNNFVLTMSLASGAKKLLPGITQQVPQYAKIDPRTGNNVMAYEVAPAEDLGALGTIIVPAHGTVRTTVTFITQDPLANANDNRAVTLQ